MKENTENTGKPTNYYVPEQSNLPIIGSVGLFVLVLGAGNFIQGTTDTVSQKEGSLPEFMASMGPYVLTLGLLIVFYLMYKWWSTAARESMANMNSAQLDRSYRQGMLWFITSEVMFFAAFFGALWYARVMIVPWLGGEGNNAMTHALLWPDFNAIWPVTTTPDGTTTQAMGPWGLPAINTAILLTSSWTLTIAHHALIDKNRPTLILFTWITAFLGVIFLGLQAYEYYHAYTDLGLTLGSGIYGNTFFMLTGFHGLHVTIGTIFLIVLSIRCSKGHFTPENHFAYEAGAWYWHFVDVVWLFLFVFVYAL
ncbi:MAG: cytochrome c oxidase subunit 3 [Gammaproteobacteria bacterium]|nr:cytochrome c oxidase subunit 3 [Gammaproteobacteria bacterium]NVK89246.1 cytochrome c oxidase subunit 3 [Gammaproteobacteria bacterium]